MIKLFGETWIQFTCALFDYVSDVPVGSTYKEFTDLNVTDITESNYFSDSDGENTERIIDNERHDNRINDAAISGESVIENAMNFIETTSELVSSSMKNSIIYDDASNSAVSPGASASEAPATPSGSGSFGVAKNIDDVHSDECALCNSNEHDSSVIVDDVPVQLSLPDTERNDTASTNNLNDSPPTGNANTQPTDESDKERELSSLLKDLKW